MSNAALILAAGRGRRIQEITSDKILASVAGRPVIALSLEAFARSGCVTTFAIVYRDEAQRQALQPLVDSAAINTIKVIWVAGGTERQDSVLNGLEALPEETRLVFIHDAARPLITAQTIRHLGEKAAATGAACLARRVTDTIKQVQSTGDPGNDAFQLRTIDRSLLWAVETPQVFERKRILEAYRKIRQTGRFVTDDTAALEESGQPVALVESSSPNPKLTTASDIAYIEYLVKLRTETLQ